MNAPSIDHSASKRRALQLRMPVFVVIVAGCALVMWAWKYNRANLNVAKATLSLRLDELSRSDDPKMRRNAALTLGDTPSELAAEALEPLLIAATRDPEPGVRGAAATALSRVLSGGAWERSAQEMADQIDRTLPTLVGLMDDPDPMVRALVADALGTTVTNLARVRQGKIDAEMSLVTKTLVNSLSEDRDANVRVQAAEALGTLRFQWPAATSPSAKIVTNFQVSPDPAIVLPALERAIKNDDSRLVRSALVLPLAKYHPKPDEAPPILLNILRRKNDTPVNETILVLLANGWGLPTKPAIWSNSDDLWTITVDYLADGTRIERHNAGKMITNSLGPPPQSVVPVLLDLLKDPNTPDRETIVFHLANLPTKGNWAFMALMSKGMESLKVTAIAELNHGRCGSAMVLSLLKPEPDDLLEVRRALVANLDRSIRERRTVSPKPSSAGETPLAISGDPRDFAVALANFGPQAADVVPELLEIFHDSPEPRWRDIIADIFMAIGPDASAALPALKERAVAEIRLRDGQPIPGYAGTLSIRAIPIFAAAVAMSAIDPNSSETRSLFVPMATVAVSSRRVEYQRAAWDWLLNMVKLDPSLLDQLDDAAHATSDLQLRDDLLKLTRKLAPPEVAPEDERNAP
jgi:HEAT repeat protein